MKEVHGGRTQTFTPFKVPDEAIGCGFHEAVRGVLSHQPWPTDAPIDLEGTLQWIYHGDGINRHDLRRLKKFFEQSPFELDWIYPLPDDASPERAAVAAYLARVLPYTAEELLTRGLSLLLRKR